MTEFRKIAAMVMATGFLVMGVAGCQKEEGPAEKAGKAIDNAVQKAGKEIEKAGENIQKSAEEAKK